MTKKEPYQSCQHCGKSMDAKSIQGLCPACLMKAGWPTSEETAPGGFEPLAIEDVVGLFPQLEILELIGRGGMGAVYKARQLDLDRFVALKILARKTGADPGFSERFTREARALAKLSHPNIVGVHDFGHTGDLSYFIMEYVDGPNLREIEQAGQLKPGEALEIIPQICAALQFAHDTGVVHRDIKPENILLDQKGCVKIADFGLAKIMGQERATFTLTEAHHVMGTPHYMAPEQVEHPTDVDHRADIYSLGVVFYEMLTGELPLGKFPTPSKKVRVDIRLDQVVLRTLEKEPALRYQQVSEVRTEVETIVSNPQTRTRQQGASTLTQEALHDVLGRLRIAGVGVGLAGFLDLCLLLIGLWIVFVAPNTGVMLLPVLLLATLTGIVLAGASHMSHLRHYRLVVLAAILAMLPPGIIFGLPFGIWALILLSQKEVRQAFQQNVGDQTFSATLMPQRGWETDVADCLKATGLHAILMIGILSLTMFVAPRFNAMFNSVSIALPKTVTVSINLIDFVRRFGLILTAPLLLVDLGIGFLLRHFLKRSAFRTYSFACSIMLVVIPLVLFGILVRSTQDVLWGQRQLRQHQMSSFAVQLPQGTIELVAVSDEAGDHPVWWKPDGSLSDEPFVTSRSGLTQSHDTKIRQFVLSFRGFTEDQLAEKCWKHDPGSAGVSTGRAGYTGDKQFGQLVMQSLSLPVSASTVNISVGLGLDAWDTVAQYPGDVGNEIELTHQGNRWMLHFFPPVKSEGNIQVTIVHNVKDWPYRFVAVDINGAIHEAHIDGTTTRLAHVQATFENMQMADIKDFQFQVRPYHWATFKGVALTPR